ncbi:MAG: hypothetical protein FWH36_07370 [Lentimicrobiaceae bacterium]|nr:hypothetical protein [Lentimicrobiaceae bacterium]
MKKFFLPLFLFFISCSEQIDYSKNNHFSTYEIGDKLYREVYMLYYGGVFANDVYSVYITDSTSFRKYVSTSKNDQQRIITELIGDNNVIVIKVENNLFNKEDTLETKIYDISTLKKEGKFE